MPVAFQGSSFLLTYPQTSHDLSPRLLSHLRDSDPPAKFTCLGREFHEDGSPHIHILVYYGTKIRRSGSFWDVDGRHPNIETVGRRTSDWQRVHDYVRKSGDYEESGSPRHSEQSVWAQVLEAQTREEALSKLAAEKPRELVANRRNIDYFLVRLLFHFIYYLTLTLFYL